MQLEVHFSPFRIPSSQQQPFGNRLPNGAIVGVQFGGVVAHLVGRCGNQPRSEEGRQGGQGTLDR